MPNADDTDDALDTRVDRPNPDHRSTPITGAINAQAIGVHFWQRAEKCHGGLHVCHTTIRCEATACAGTFSPAFIIEGHHHIAGLVQDPCIVREIEIFHARIAMTQHDTCTSLTGPQIVRIIHIPYELVPLTIKCHRSFHGQFTSLPFSISHDTYCSDQSCILLPHVSSEHHRCLQRSMA